MIDIITVGPGVNIGLKLALRLIIVMIALVLMKVLGIFNFIGSDINGGTDKLVFLFGLNSFRYEHVLNPLIGGLAIFLRHFVIAND